MGWWLNLSMTQIGKILIISGLVFLAIGCIMFLFGDKIKWFGNMRLDFSYKSVSARIYAPFGGILLSSHINNSKSSQVGQNICKSW